MLRAALFAAALFGGHTGAAASAVTDDAPRLSDAGAELADSRSGADDVASVAASVRLMFDAAPSRVSVAAGQSFAAAAEAWCTAAGLEGADFSETSVALAEALRGEHRRLLDAPAKRATVAQIDVLLDSQQVVLVQHEGETPEAAARAFLVSHGINTHLQADAFLRTFVHRLRAAAGIEDGLPRLQQDHGLIASVPVNIEVDTPEEQGGGKATARYMLQQMGGETPGEAVEGFITRLGLRVGADVAGVLVKSLEDAAATAAAAGSGGGGAFRGPSGDSSSGQPFREGLSRSGGLGGDASGGVSAGAGGGDGRGGAGSRSGSDAAQSRDGAAGASNGAAAGAGAASDSGAAAAAQEGAQAEAAAAAASAGTVGALLRIPVQIDGVTFQMAIPTAPELPDPVEAAAEFLSAAAASTALPTVEGPDGQPVSVLQAMDADGRTALLVGLADEVARRMEAAGFTPPTRVNLPPTLLDDMVIGGEVVAAGAEAPVGGVEVAGAALAANVAEVEVVAGSSGGEVEAPAVVPEVEAVAAVPAAAVEEAVAAAPEAPADVTAANVSDSAPAAAPAPPADGGLLASIKLIFASFFSS